MEIVFLIIAVTASVVGAMSGIGGGVIIKPVMDALQVMDISSINFLSGGTVLSMAAYSFFKNRKNAIELNYKVTVFLTIGASLGGIAGKSIFGYIHSGLAAIQSAKLLIINVLVLLYILKKEKMVSLKITNHCVCLSMGFVLGAVSSFLGIGGGPMNIAVLYYFFSMTPKEAAKNSLFIILFSQITSLCTTLITRTVPPFDVITMVVMCTGGIIGAEIGSYFSKRMDNNALERFFLIVLYIIIFINMYNFFQSVRPWIAAT